MERLSHYGETVFLATDAEDIVALIGRAFVWESCLLGFLKVRTAGICSLCKCLPKYAVAAETWELCRHFHDSDIPTLVPHISLSQFKTLKISTQWNVVLWSNDRWGLMLWNNHEVGKRVALKKTDRWHVWIDLCFAFENYRVYLSRGGLDRLTVILFFCPLFQRLDVLNSNKDTNILDPPSLQDPPDQRYLNSTSTFALGPYERQREEIKRGNTVFPFISALACAL